MEGLRNQYKSVNAEVIDLEKQLAAKRKELDTICLASIAVESEERKFVPVFEIPRSTEFQVVIP